MAYLSWATRPAGMEDDVSVIHDAYRTAWMDADSLAAVGRAEAALDRIAQRSKDIDEVANLRRHTRRQEWRAMTPEQRSTWKHRHELRWLPHSPDEARRWQRRGAVRRARSNSQRDRWIARAYRRLKNAAAVARQLAVHPTFEGAKVTARQVLNIVKRLTASRPVRQPRPKIEIGNLPHRPASGGVDEGDDLREGEWEDLEGGRVAYPPGWSDDSDDEQYNDDCLAASIYAHLFTS